MKIKYKELFEISSQFLTILFLPVTFIFIFISIYMTGFVGVSSFVVLFSFIAFLFYFRFFILDVNFYFVVFTFFYMFLYVVSFYIFFGDLIDNSGKSLFFFNSSYIVFSFSSYLLGRYFLNTNLEFLRLYLFFYFMMVFLVLVYADFNYMMLDKAYLVDEDSFGSYLKLSDVFCVFSLILLGCVHRLSSKFFLFLLSVVILLILNSRSSLYFYIFISIFYFSFFYDIKRNIIFIVSLVLIMILFIDEISSLSEVNSRMFFIFLEDIDASESSRNSLFSEGLIGLLNSPFWGDYDGVIIRTGSLGGYIHNILSYWQTYGVFVFLMVFYFFIFQAIKSVFLAFFDRKSRFAHVVFLLSLYLLLSVIFSKSYVWIYAWFCLGNVHNYLSIRKV